MQKLKNLINHKKYDKKEDLLGEYIKMSDVIYHRINCGEITDEYYLFEIARSTAMVNEIAGLALEQTRANNGKQSESEKNK